MPRPIFAPSDGMCARCGKPYSRYSKVTYSLKAGKDERYHYPSCELSTVGSFPHRVETPSVLDVPEFMMPEFMETNPSTILAVKEPKPIVSNSLSRLTNSSKWYEILPHLTAAGLTRILLVGPPGTGKSKTASEGYAYRVTCHPDAGQEEMAGTFIQRSGQTEFIDGAGTLALRQGTRLILDEIDHCSQETKSLLYAFLDDEPGIRLATGEFVKAVPGYEVVCTTNANPGDLEDAILDRIEAVLIADSPHIKALESATVKLRDKNAHKAKQVEAVINNYYKNALPKSNWQWTGKPTLRRMRNLANLLAAGMNETVAATVVFGNGGKEVLSSLTTAAI